MVEISFNFHTVIKKNQCSQLYQFFFHLQGLHDGHWTSSSINHKNSAWNYDNFYNSNQRSSISMPNLDGGTFRSGSHNGPVAEGTFSFGLLLPNTEYEVKIRAKNKYGWSEEEPFFVFKTSRLGKYFQM